MTNSLVVVMDSSNQFRELDLNNITFFKKESKNKVHSIHGMGSYPVKDNNNKILYNRLFISVLLESKKGKSDSENSSDFFTCQYKPSVDGILDRFQNCKILTLVKELRWEMASLGSIHFDSMVLDKAKKNFKLQVAGYKVT